MVGIIKKIIPISVEITIQIEIEEEFLKKELWIYQGKKKKRQIKQRKR